MLTKDAGTPGARASRLALANAPMLRLRGRYLIAARAVWITLVVLTLTIFFASVPPYLAQLQTTCAGATCQYQQLTFGQAQTLKEAGLSLGDYAVFTITLMLIDLAVCLVVSAVIIWRKSDDWMALLVALMLVTLGPIIEAATANASNSPWQIPNESLTFLQFASFMLVFSLFPSGQFAPRWMRWVVPVFVLAEIPFTFFPAAATLLDMAVSQPGWLVTLSGFVVIALAQLHRYRRVSSPLQRQQTKWVVFGTAAPIVILLGGSVLALLFPALNEVGSFYPLVFNECGFLLPLFIPLSFGFAILRYRLWDIDAIINKALVYGSLTALLAGVYAILVIAFQALAGRTLGNISDKPVVLVISTLATAALIQPIRRRLQTAIDRRFYRRKYDAERSLVEFSAAMRNEVDLNDLSADLLTMAQQTMEPEHVSLWLSRRRSQHELE